MKKSINLFLFQLHKRPKDTAVQDAQQHSVGAAAWQPVLLTVYYKKHFIPLGHEIHRLPHTQAPASNPSPYKNKGGGTE